MDSFLPDAIAAQPRSIWYKYVRTAEKWDRRMMEKWKTNMNNLLIFVGFTLPEAVFLVLTSIKVALFTTIVTAFILDVMSDLDEDTATTLLCILVEQSTANSTIEIPPPNPPSSTLTVSSLWLLSIMSSLAATTWAMLCLEWCAFLTDGVQAEDYEEMAEKRQRKFEAVKRWRMHLIVAAIPFFLQMSLFLFLTGLWLRLRDMNNQLGLIVGVPSLIIALSYVVVTLLPIFTDAPFSTSASEFIQPVVDGIRHLVELGRFIQPPPVFLWITGLLPAGGLFCILGSFSIRTCRLIALPKRIYRVVRRCIHTLWKAIALLPIVPTFGLDQNPFDELNKLKVGRSGQDRGIHLRALFWLMNTPLSEDEVKEILKEFRNRGNPEEPLDRTIIRLLVLSLSSVLEDNRIGDDERPIFNHCTTALAREMDRAFGDGEHNRRILFRNTMISEKLSPHFRLTPCGGDTPSRHSATGREEDYWTRAVPALWLCPSTETIRSVVDQLNLDIQSVKTPRLHRIVRGLHAATLACFNPDQSTLELIPDFNTWSWDPGSFDQTLDQALSGYLQALFVAFYNTLPRSDSPITTPSLVVDCLKVLDDQPERYTLKLHNALSFFVAVMRRSNPKVFEEGPSVTRALLTSAESYGKPENKGNTSRAEVLATRLRAIAYGPKPLVTMESRSLTILGDLHALLPDSIKTNEQCLEGFLDANAATLEATLAVDGRFTVFTWQRSPDYRTARNIWADSLFTHHASFDFVRRHKNYRLPYLYSLAIALSYTTEGRNWGLWKMVNLLMTNDEREEIAIERALDTNILVVTVLGFALCDQSEPVEEERMESFLKLLRNIVINGDGWRTRWKSVYLITDLVHLLSRMNGQYEGDGHMKALIDVASNSLEEEQIGRVPSDWKRKRKGLALCKLDTKVKALFNLRGETSEAVYEWSGRESIPYLSLYNPQRAPTKPVSNAVSWVASMFQR